MVDLIKFQFVHFCQPSQILLRYSDTPGQKQTRTTSDTEFRHGGQQLTTSTSTSTIEHSDVEAVICQLKMSLYNSGIVLMLDKRILNGWYTALATTYNQQVASSSSNGSALVSSLWSRISFIYFTVAISHREITSRFWNISLD